MAAYDLVGDAYDIVYPDTAERVPFVNDLLTKFGKRTILDLGIGTGLFAIPLRQAGFEVEGLEISEVMIDVLRLKAPDIKVHQGDIRHFALDKRYEAILAFSSVLIMVNTHQEIRQCLECAYEHLQAEGLLLLELPNHPVEIALSNNSQEVHSSDGDGTIVVIQSRVEDQQWAETWHIFRQSESGFSQEKVLCEEFLYSPEILMQQLQEVGFDVIEEYGDLLGNRFDEASSWRRVLICKKNGAEGHGNKN